jgi:hypothetical protein
MKYMSTLLAVLLLVGSLAVLPLYTEEGDGGEYSGPPAAENEAVILSDEGGGDGVQEEPSPEEARIVVLV